MQSQDIKDAYMRVFASYKINPKDPDLDKTVADLAKKARLVFSGFNDADIAYICYGLKKLPTNNSDFQNLAIQKYATKALDDSATPKHVVMLANALCKPKSYYRTLQEQNAHRTAMLNILKKPKDNQYEGFDLVGLSLLLNAATKIEGRDAEKICFDILAVVFENADTKQFEPAQIALFANALALIDCFEYANIMVNKIKDLLEKQTDVFTNEGCVSVYQYLLNTAIQTRILSYSAHKVSAVALKLCLSHFKDKHYKDTSQPSALQKDVTYFLKAAYPNETILEEYPIVGSHVDIAIPSRKLVIEVQGPGHTYIDDEGKWQKTRKTNLKLRLLANEDWDVIEISYHIWKRLDPSQKQQFWVKKGLTEKYPMVDMQPAALEIVASANYLPGLFSQMQLGNTLPGPKGHADAIRDEEWPALKHH